MGIKGLGAFIKGYGTKCTMNTLKNSTIAIDTPIYLFKYKYLTSCPEEIIEKFSKQLNTFKRNNITPVYIFDGKHSILKKETQQNRKKSPNSMRVTESEKQKLKELLDKESVKWIIAPGEAEKYCCYLNSRGHVDYILSNDYDTFVFGCEKLVVSNKAEYIMYKPVELIADFGVTKDQFTEACVASGCDFLPGGVPGIGIKKAFSLLKKNPDSLKEVYSEEYAEKLPEILSIFNDYTEESKILFESTVTEEI
jgi:5'-3' exonuclease